jgi:hypothetical protein
LYNIVEVEPRIPEDISLKEAMENLKKRESDIVDQRICLARIHHELQIFKVENEIMCIWI